MTDDTPDRRDRRIEKKTMEYTKLGSTGMDVPRICLGRLGPRLR